MLKKERKRQEKEERKEMESERKERKERAKQAKKERRHRKKERKEMEKMGLRERKRQKKEEKERQKKEIKSMGKEEREQMKKEEKERKEIEKQAKKERERLHKEKREIWERQQKEQQKREEERESGERQEQEEETPKMSWLSRLYMWLINSQRTQVVRAINRTYETEWFISLNISGHTVQQLVHRTIRQQSIRIRLLRILRALDQDEAMVEEREQKRRARQIKTRGEVNRKRKTKSVYSRAKKAFRSQNRVHVPEQREAKIYKLH
ncbi:uncharacterized protein LOC130166939 [Seriola aureovittata]|uniref:uncharacterized protein LOC130166939 n=1 Tax=Seriola aureovittata TaxID=2871759 RepID=UPI0024BE20DB|nr:uncharacterized protein LOC130166939 [Seriola aureovittata]